MRSIDREFLHAVLAVNFDPVLADALVAKGADINHMPDLDDQPGGDEPTTPLMQAAGGGHVAAVAYLLRQPGIDINKTTDEEYINALMRVCTDEPAEILPIAEMLIKAGTDLSHCELQGWAFTDFVEKLNWQDKEMPQKLTTVLEKCQLEKQADMIAEFFMKAATPVRFPVRKLTRKVAL